MPRKRSIEFNAGGSPKNGDWRNDPEGTVRAIAEKHGGRLESLAFTLDCKKGHAVIDTSAASDEQVASMLVQLDAIKACYLLSPEDWLERRA